MENMRIYEFVRSCQKDALRQITGGKLKGKSDINPMWRIKKLTELFGPVGIGWKPVVKNQWTVPAANGEIAAFVEIELYIKDGGEWSEPIPGTGGSMLITTEKGMLVSNDECFKMAYTDAISVACKTLGFAADIYWENDSSKYTAKKANVDANNVFTARKWLSTAKYDDEKGLRIVNHLFGYAPESIDACSEDQLNALTQYIRNALHQKMSHTDPKERDGK